MKSRMHIDLLGERSWWSFGKRGIVNPNCEMEGEGLEEGTD